MPASRKIAFREAVLASGLVSEAELEHARTGMSIAGQPPEDEYDKLLAAKLIELGHLNHWQVEQLRRGRVKWTLGAYRILDAIGQGGMGQVFKAEHSIMRRVVAVKVLPLDRTTPESVDNFLRETQAQAHLDHPNLVRAFDAGRDGNVHFLVTEYVPGMDLRRLVRGLRDGGGALSMNVAAAIISQAAYGLDHAHSRGLIHRDIKPGNLLVTPEGVCKVSDLGLAGYLDEEDDARKNKTVGTADYLSPEQILTPQNLTPTCDIYALGCTLYYAVTGKVPFPGGNTKEKARRHCYDQPLDPRRLSPDLDNAFVDVIADMMVKDARHRIRSAREVIRRLSPWAGDDWTNTAAVAMQQPRLMRTRVGPPPPPIMMDYTSMTDTKPIPEIMERPESTSQVSQGTLAMTSASEETLSAFDSRPSFIQPQSRISPVLIWLIGLSVVAVAAAIIALIYNAIV
ncbi:MAG: serine/threonine protein kinase [Pirellulales bacterium]|nr:serine/threonine protein kinase [Pirellulales bacterium]